MIAPQAVLACVLMAANTYQLPPAVMIGIMDVEGGHVGTQSLNLNGTYDLGPMQVNTIWLAKLERLWHVNRRTAYVWLRDDACVNVHVGAWILKQKIVETGSLYGGISHYHSATHWRGANYAAKVISAMDRRGLIRHDVPIPYTQYAER